MNNITVIGSLSTDFVVESHKRPAVGETVIGDNFTTTFGGKGANQAVASAKLGANVAMIGAVGKDEFGALIKDNLQKNQINVDNVEPVTQAGSGSAHITLADGDNSIIVVQGANALLDKEMVFRSKERIDQSQMVILQQEIDAKLVEEVIVYCDEHQIPSILNPAPFREVPESLLAKTSYFTPNEQEAKALFKDITIQEAVAKYPNQLIVTMGKEGVLFHDGEKEVVVEGFTVKPVDTTGAGDTFNGAFAVGIVNGLSIESSIRFANLAASISIQKLGAQGGMPTLEEMKGSQHFEKEWNFK